ncbi:hypothetical protein Tco_0408538 [Tanacetum coccineum]
MEKKLRSLVYWHGSNTREQQWAQKQGVVMSGSGPTRVIRVLYLSVRQEGSALGPFLSPSGIGLQLLERKLRNQDGLDMQSLHERGGNISKTSYTHIQIYLSLAVIDRIQTNASYRRASLGLVTDVTREWFPLTLK